MFNNGGFLNGRKNIITVCKKAKQETLPKCNEVEHFCKISLVVAKKVI